MRIFPAIDLYDGKAVRLYKGDYQQMTIYNENPVAVAEDFVKSGAEYLHLVDLEGAKSGETPNISVIENIIRQTDLFTEVGEGIRSIEVIDRYLSIGVKRVILGTAAVTDDAFLRESVKKYGDSVAVGVDLKDGVVAIKGWTEGSAYTAESFLEKLSDLGVKTIICTDISKDGAMMGANHELYEGIHEKYGMDLIASGGVSSMQDVTRLAKLGIYGAIIGKAYYTGAINLKEAIEAAK